VVLPLRPKPACWHGHPNQQQETARHEYFLLLSLLETVMGSRKVAARGELFSCHE